MSFIEDLAKKGTIKKGDIAAIEEEMASTGISLDKALEARGISKEDILKKRGEYLNLPVKKLDAKTVSFEVLKYVPEESAVFYKFVPLSVQDGVLQVGIVDPENMGARDALQFIASKLGLPFKLVLISNDDFETIIGNYKGLTGEVSKALTELDQELADADDVTLGVEAADAPETRIIEDAPVTKIVAVILRHATEGNASDIHIEPTEDKVKVRFRVDGVLHTSLLLPRNVHSAVVARVKILSELKLDEKRKPQDGRFSARIEGRKIDFRVSTFPTYYGEKVEMRILDTRKGILSLESIGLFPEHAARVRELLKRPYGLILLTGPTGSGKSTTLYSMLNEVDRQTKNVVSLEDPVEFSIPDMSQSQIAPEIDYSFATGLRSILRQDPDIIMVGEIRDKETAQLAIQAALTGHLVLSTLHTNSAIGAIPRLVDMGVDPYLIAPTLIMTAAQRLPRVICKGSENPIPVDGAIKMMIEKQFADLPAEFRKPIEGITSLNEAKATAECPSGTRGRTAVFELLEIDKDIARAILTNPTEPEIWKIARAKGFMTMREDALIKSAKGIVPFQEVNSL